MKKAILFSFVILAVATSCKTNKEFNHPQMAQISDEMFPELVEIRRDLHQHPELSGQEIRTSQLVANYLRELGMIVHKNIGGHGVVGILNPDKKGNKIAWRADMDAIRFEDQADSSFQSVNDGVSHNCGHDVHTTIGLGIAKVMSQFKEQLNGSIYFVFQPSEETFTGAQSMLEEGLLEIIQPDEIYGLHVFPSEVGTIQTKTNELFAYQQTVALNFEKQSSKEKLEIYLSKLMQSMARQSSGESAATLDELTTIDNGLQSKQTIYSDYFFATQIFEVPSNELKTSYQLTVYETDQIKMEAVIGKLSDEIKASEFDKDFIDIKSLSKNPTVINDPILTDAAMTYLTEIFGDERIEPIYGQIPYFNEDFIYFQKKIPGALFLLGASNEEKNIIAMPHTPDFQVDVQAINYGVQYFSQLLMHRVNSKPNK